MTKTLAALAVATATLTACNPNPYAPQSPAVIDELEAGSLAPINGVTLWVRMITEGDFVRRCTDNLDGTYAVTWAGHVCVVEGE